MIFLAPIDELEKTATVDFIYTPAYRHELERRLKIMMNEEQLAATMERVEVDNLTAYVEWMVTPSGDRQPLPQSAATGPETAWKDHGG